MSHTSAMEGQIPKGHYKGGLMDRPQIICFFFSPAISREIMNTADFVRNDR